jgi:ABC-type transporter Mla subunit MlaD
MTKFTERPPARSSKIDASGKADQLPDVQNELRAKHHEVTQMRAQLNRAIDDAEQFEAEGNRARTEVLELLDVLDKVRAVLKRSPPMVGEALRLIAGELDT